MKKTNYKLFWKKTVNALQLCILISIITACGTIKEFNEQTISEEQTIFKNSILEVSDMNGFPGTFTISDSGKEVLVLPYRTPEQNECSQLYVVDFNTQKAIQLPNPDITTEDDYLALFFDSKDNRFAVYSTNTRRTVKHNYFLVKWDKNNNMVSKVDISDSMKDTVQGNYFNLLSDEKNRIVILTESQAIILTENGEPACIIPSENGKIECSARMKNGKIICGIQQDKKTKIEILNVEKKEFGKPICLGINTFEDSYALKNGMDYDFYFRDNSTFYGYDLKGGYYEKILDLEKSNIITGMEWDITPISKEKMLGTTFDKETGKISFVLLTK